MSALPPIQETVTATEPSGAAQALMFNREAAALGFAWTAGFSFVAKVIFPLAGLYVSRTLGPGILGIAAILQMTLQLSEVIRDAGLNQTFLAEVEVDPRKQAEYAGLALLMGLVPAVLLLLLTPFFASFFRQAELRWALPWVAACLVMNALGAVPNGLLLRNGELKRQGAIGLVTGGFALAVTIVLVALGVGFPALVVQLVLGCALGLVLVVRAAPLCGISFDAAAIRSTLRRSGSLLGANLINNVFLLCDIFVIQRMAGAKAAGLYNTAQNIAYKPADLLLFPLGKTLMVAFSQAAADPVRLARAYYRSLAAIVLVVLPIYVLIGLNSQAIIGLLLGEKFLGGVPVLQALCVYLACRTLGNISGNALVPAGRHNWTFWPWVLALCVTAAGVAWTSGSSAPLMGIVWSFTGGAIAVYALIFGLALYAFRPQAREARHVWLSLLVSGALSAVLVLVACLVSAPMARLLLCLAVGLPVQLAAAGLAFEGRITAYMSRKGVRGFWRRL